MKHGIVKALAAVALVTVVSAAPAVAQTGVEFGLGGGLTLPLGTTNDAFKTGWNGQVAALIKPAGSPVGVQIDGLWSQMKTDVTDAGKARTLAGTANLVYGFPVSKTTVISPYLIGGVGIYNVKFTDETVTPSASASDTKFGFNVGAGFNVGQGRTKFYGEGRFHDVLTDGDNFKMFPITVGIRFGA